MTEIFRKAECVLVTGGCGFIGCNFVHNASRLLPEARIVCFDKLTYAGNMENLAGAIDGERVSFVKADICDKEAVEKVFADHGVTTVVHFAAESHVDRSIYGPEEFVRTNIHGTFVLLEVARKNWVEGGKDTSAHCFLHVSTDEVYGSLGPTGYFTETTPYDPRSPYSASKASADHLANAYFHTYGLPVVITNCSNNYGPYQFPEKLIPLVTLNALEGRELPVYGDGKNVRDWLHVVDHCEAISRCIRNGKAGESFNIGGNNERTNIEIVETICDVVDEMAQPLASGLSRRSLIRFVTDRPGHDRRYAIDATKIKTSLGWTPRIGFREGLAATVKWYLENSDWVKDVRDGSYREYYEKMYGSR